MQTESVLKALQHVPTEANQRALAKKIGCSIGKTNYVLKALIEKGWVKAERFAASNNKLGYRYVLTPQGVTERLKLTERFVALKQQEYQALKQQLKVLKEESAQEGHEHA
jgi:EPS-associated MarR family transcriptional regulator